MEPVVESFTTELTIQPGAVVDGSPSNGFGESIVMLRATSRGAPSSGTADLRWGDDQLATGISAATFLAEFWSGRSVAHADALEFGRLLLRRLLGHPVVRDRWNKIQGWRGPRPQRLELILPSAHDSPISAVPFELLADDRSFLYYGGSSILVRCIRDLDARRATIRRGDRLLVAWANPLGVEPQVDDNVFQQHETALVDAARRAHLDVLTPVANTDLARFQNALTMHRPVPVVSLAAHGYATGGKLAFENTDRTPQPVSASTIAGTLRASQAQVALLWSCHGARHHEDLGSLAERLLHPDGGDLAAVLAVHGALRADWTARAAQRIFESLSASAANDFEQAITHARQTLTEQDPQWAALAYHARPAEGRSVTYEEAARATVATIPVTTPRADQVEGIPSRPYYWVDRPTEVNEIAFRVVSARLVTVRGMPGIGKTEVTREAADRLISDSTLNFQSALWIALDSRRTVDDLRGRIASWAGVNESDLGDWKLAKAIGERRALWVLDNAEDLVSSDGASLRSFLGAILESCPGVRLLVTSQRPVGNLRGEREDTYHVRRIEDLATCRKLFAAASGSPLGTRIDSDEVRVLLELLDGHPRSLVLVASQIRDGGANLSNILARLREHGDEAVLAAELLGSGADWDDHDRLRAERLVSSLQLAYQPLLQHAPAAAELFTWLGLLPAGLPVALAGAIFGDDTPERIAILSRFSLVELRGDEERLNLPAPVRWYAVRRLDKDITPVRYVELLIATLTAIGELMAAAYSHLGKPGASSIVEICRRETANLDALLRCLERFPRRHSVAQLIAHVFAHWSRVREHGGHHEQAIALLERAATYIAALDTNVEGYGELLFALGRTYFRNASLSKAEETYQRALVTSLSNGDRICEANIRWAIGELNFRTDRLPDAHQAFQEALAASVALGDRLGEGNTQLSLGEFYVRNAQLAEARESYERARIAFSAVNARIGEANAQTALGDLHMRQDRFSEAEDAYRSALATFTAIEDRLGEASALRALGVLHVRKHQFSDAEHAYQKALKVFSAINNRLGQANTISALGELAVVCGHPAKGFELLRTAYTMLLTEESGLGAAGQLGYMARAARVAGLINRAIVLSGLALWELRKREDRLGLVLAGIELIASAEQAGNHELWASAIILSWHRSKGLGHPIAIRLDQAVKLLLPAGKTDVGLEPEEIDTLERKITAAIEEVARRLMEAGEDPLSPLPLSTDEP
jgi:tetratricopeptide (TPR) repeat protein